MEEQNFKNHTKYVPAFHFFLIPLLMITFIGALVKLYRAISHDGPINTAALIAMLSLGALMAAFFARIFALQAQDRVIRVEENLRHQALSGKPLDSRLTRGQIVALRFASDGEFVALAAAAANKGMASKEIKQAIKSWRADNFRL